MAPHTFPFFSRNGTILPMREALIPLTSIEYSYGFGVYETIRIQGGKAIFLGEHVERLLYSATRIRLQHTCAAKKIERWIQDLMGKLGKERYNIKVLLIGGKRPQDAQISILPLHPHFPEKQWYRQGVGTITVAFERPIPDAKTLNMLRSYLAHREATEHDCYEALSLHEDGCIYEGTRSNFYVVRGETVITPPKGTILEGITRTHILALAREDGIEVLEERISAATMREFDGAFLTSSSMKVMPIRSIDGHTFGGIPKTTKKLMKLYDELLATQI